MKTMHEILEDKFLYAAFICVLLAVGVALADVRDPHEAVARYIIGFILLGVAAAMGIIQMLGRREGRHDAVQGISEIIDKL
ncbi:MAG TPA: hypothetical protein VMV50_00005 [Candidatus Paceibacterota bacterium]|nr:hypothetical protein [Candidatus Paceibacterota bacterium]